ncbi:MULTISPECIES: DUF418 domain-containing protein [Niallia]|uniref:DUF418 domain-containing protein n=1 Tax=Niallia circulans TaxID=1397 RepID=A0A941GB21_NIACI|nr:DUF418 domain-containing protein [Niallia circulans]MCB5237242.1 DUF418 domain-containing protein [Niallia circulans]QJX65092.1 DUF418 domain-containing protein [Niallia circulans]
MKKERIHSIDIIRGFAILGIAFANILPLSGPHLYESSPSSIWMDPIDKLVESILFIFAEGNFYSLFSILFGFSAIIFMENAEDKGYNPYYLFSKRLWILFAIGFLHAFFIFYGDILMIYAVIGLFLLPVYKVPGRVMMLLIGIFMIPMLFELIKILLFDYQIAAVDYNLLQNVIINYQTGGRIALLQNTVDWLTIYSIENLPSLFCSIYPMFLLGMILGKNKALITNIKEIHKLMWVISGSIGIAIKTLAIIYSDSYFLIRLSEIFGNISMSIFYGLSILLLLKKTGKHFKLIANIGKTSMSNYLFQTTCCFFMFKVFKLYAQVSPGHLVFLSIALIFIQILLSNWWLKKHKQGPIESVWRKLTYYKRTPSYNRVDKK